MTDVPLPPPRLARRVGALEGKDPLRVYEDLGRHTRDQILGLLPNDWTFADKRVLDFGCGAGRTLRQFLSDASLAELWGCDIDAESVEWLAQSLSPPLHVFHSEEQPPLPRSDSEFDLVWAVSVFTHLTDYWAEWLLELHRVLKPDGWLIATVLGPQLGAEMARGQWDEDRIGMNVIAHWQSWEEGGPTVLHSEWWLRAHWGRAFEIVEFRRPPAGTGAHTWLLLRPRPGKFSPDDLRAPTPDDARELLALRHNLRQVQSEMERLVANPVWRSARRLRLRARRLKSKAPFLRSRA